MELPRTNCDHIFFAALLQSAVIATVLLFPFINAMMLDHINFVSVDNPSNDIGIQ